MIRDMRRVYLIYTQDRRDELLVCLQKLGVLHLELSHLESDSERRSENAWAETRRKVENLLIKARGILDLFEEVDPGLLKVKPEELSKRPTRPEELSQALYEELRSLEDRLKALVSERRELRDRQAAIERFREVIRTGEELLKILPTEHRELLSMIGQTQGDPWLAELEKTIHTELPGRVSLASKTLPQDRVLLVVSVDPEYAPAVRDYLETKGFRPLSLPSHIETGFAEGIAQLRSEERTIPERLQQIERELRTLAGRHAARMVMLANALENRLAQLDAATRFGYTEYTLLISGWVPADELKSFQELLAREFPEIIIQQDPIKPSYEDIPVAFKHRPWAKPYELFLKAFGTPKHGSIDPVPIISIFFPIFFAVIVGDVGYGLVLLGLALWGLKGFPGLKAAVLKRVSRSDAGRKALRVVLHASAFTILFGLLFGELFGLEGWTPWPHYSRLHDPVPLMLFAIGIGAIQVVLGFLFGMKIAWRRRDPKHLAAKIGLFLALTTIAFGMGMLLGFVPEALRTPWLILALIAVALPLLMYGGGGVVVMEGIVALTPFVHVLSYLRLMGFAVAGVVLASLANMLVGSVGALGGLILGTLLGAIVALVMHAFNLVLHAFEGAVQSARLHWVEFFEKFLLEELGGKPYQPFQEKSLPATSEE